MELAHEVHPLAERPKAPVHLVAATRPYARESRRRSWWYLASTFTILLFALATAALAPWWPIRLAASVTAGLVMARAFILYHDFMHGAILRKSRLASILMHAYGIFGLAPAHSWRKSHNFHHRNVGKIEGSEVGSFWIMTTAAWRSAPRSTRLHYRVVRSPLTLLFAYVAIFLWAITAAPLFRAPLRHWDSVVALAVHAGLIAGCWALGGFTLATFVVFVPFFTAGVLGAYLFYAQHNFEGMRVFSDGEWSLQRAALESCSYLRMGPAMTWFTGDIGFHHVHHLNAAIPFYRLGEAMRGIEALQHPIVTTLRPRDIVACLRLKLWDEDRSRMVGYREAMRSARR